MAKVAYTFLQWAWSCRYSIYKPLNIYESHQLLSKASYCFWSVVVVTPSQMFWGLLAYLGTGCMLTQVASNTNHCLLSLSATRVTTQWLKQPILSLQWYIYIYADTFLECPLYNRMWHETLLYILEMLHCWLYISRTMVFAWEASLDSCSAIHWQTACEPYTDD